MLTDWANALGNARVAPARPATAATLFRMGSTSKACVALTVLATGDTRFVL